MTDIFNKAFAIYFYMKMNGLFPYKFVSMGQFDIKSTFALVMDLSRSRDIPRII